MLYPSSKLHRLYRARYTVRVILEYIRGIFSIAAVPSLELTPRKRQKIYGRR